jgi:hypothetical protein
VWIEIIRLATTTPHPHPYTQNQPENCRLWVILMILWRWVPAGKHRKSAGIHRKNPDNVRPEYRFHVPVISGNFPHLVFRILWNPMTAIIDLGTSYVVTLDVFVREMR